MARFPLWRLCPSSMVGRLDNRRQDTHRLLTVVRDRGDPPRRSPLPLGAHARGHDRTSGRSKDVCRQHG